MKQLNFFHFFLQRHVGNDAHHSTFFDHGDYGTPTTTVFVCCGRHINYTTCGDCCCCCCFLLNSVDLSQQVWQESFLLSPLYKLVDDNSTVQMGRTPESSQRSLFAAHDLLSCTWLKSAITPEQMDMDQVEVSAPRMSRQGNEWLDSTESLHLTFVDFWHVRTPYL